ncbi:Virulence-associated protein E, partial [Delftia tsuruhatensis]|uniref:virulence-associated E family protein n=2 Tax=Delftia tsuruhatensis TaxID=180282 RepID=UPI0008E1822F
STQNIKDGIATVAYTERFHPVREWLQEQEWDQEPRLDKWLIHVLGESPETLSPSMAEYLKLVGRYWVLGMIWRVMQPGCKFDYCPVLEGKGGLRKSTMVEVLAVRPEWYSDTKFDLSRGKDAYEQVRGKWVYELGELSSFSKADVNDIKAFISSKTDNYRVAYGEQAQAFPRQCVLVGSTNDKKYLRDRSGNRRFWPIPVRHVIKTEWLERMRGQLMAEAYALYQQGGIVYTPSKEEEDRLFVPMQESRLQESAVDGELFKLLTREAGMNAQFINVNAERVPINALIKALGVDIGKATPALKGQVEAWLESNGWEFKGRQRVNGALESGVYFRPAVWPPELDEVAEDWTRQDDARPEPEESRPDDLPPLPAGLGDQSSEWPGDYEPF